MNVKNTKQRTSGRTRQLVAALALAGSAGVAGASALSDAAAALQPGQWVVLDTQNLTPTLLNDGSFTVLYYSEDMTWDPVSRQILLVGGGHADDAEFLRYSEASNTWQRSAPTGTFWHSNFSHAYDHNAIAPDKGKFFFRQPAFDPSNRVEIYDIASQAWSRSAAMPNVPGCCGGLEYFPELNGLVLANGDDGLLFYNIDANSWSRITAPSWGDYHNFAEYSPVHKTLIYGGGETSGGTTVYRMNQQRQVTRLGNAPARLGTTHSVVTTDPNSGNHLVFYGSTWYEFNPATDTWRQQAGDAPWPGGVFGTVATPISTYGVVMFLNYNEGGTPRVYLYKHSPGSGTTVPGITFSANPTSVASGSTTELTWTTTDANACTASGGWSGTKATSGTETSAAITANTTFTLTCTNTSGGSSSRSVNVTLAANPAPTVTFSASPASVAVGGSSTLNWTSSNATSCTGSGGLSGWAGAKSTSGSENVGPINAATTFTLACTGSGGTTTRNTTINLLAAPTLNFSANPTTVSAGGRSTLTWSTQNATGCNATGAWTGPKALSGSEQSPVINATSTFDLQCTGAGGTTGRSVTVNLGTTPAPTVTLSASPTSVGVNGTSTLTWSSTNASSCTASNGWTGTKGTSGSEATSALSNTTTFVLTCTGAGGSGNNSTTVTVTAGGGGGGGGSSDSGGGGAMDLLMLALGVLVLGLQRIGRFIGGRRRVVALAASILGLGAGLANAADLTTVTVVSSNGSAQANVPVTFGQVFKPGDVPAGAVIGARAGSTIIPLQADKKATHADGSLRHAVLTAMVPSLGANGTQSITLTNTGTAPGGGAITTAALLATSFDVTINLDIGGTVYTASARTLLQSGTPSTWLSGPLATEWLLSAPVSTSAGVAHPHLQARFHVRAFEGLNTVRVEAVVENNWAFEVGPRNYTYNVTVNVAGGGTQYTQSSVNHYRQSRWRRVVWWGTNPQLAVRHDSAYLQATRAVPTYDPRVQLSSAAVSGWQSGLGTNPGVMSIGALEPNMPQPAGRFEIAPLPAFQAGYIMSQNDTARRVTIGYGEQAGAWPMHYRDKLTDHPISIDTYPNATIIGASGIFGNFPACGGTCTTPLTPEASHHPTLAYVPYLITGDYYLMEEMVFWGNWVLFYGEAGRHGGSQGLVVWDQVRGQAWAMRTLAQAAYATPDSHPLKAYLNQKLGNNINYFRTNWVDSNPLGYITNTGAASWLGHPSILSTWMDDFLTWTFGHMVGLGFTDAQPVLAWKAKFPVGRLTDANYCWKLASTNWVYATHRGYPGDTNTGTFLTTWTDWRRNVVYGHGESLRGTNDISGQEATLFAAACGSSQMNSILGIGSGEMIGWDGPDAYPANIQAAAAVAVEAGVPNAQQAFNVLTSRGSYPLSAYASEPEWALYPSTATANLPSVQLSANPTSVTSGQTSTLTWSSTNATSCTASGGWSGSKALSGTQATAAITATTSFVLTCTNAEGSNSASTTVSLQTPQAPTLTFSASPTTISSGGSTTLTWNSTNATGCTASGGWTGAKSASGNQQITNITATTTYTLVCTGAGGNSPTRNATVTVSSTPPPAPTVDLSAGAASVPVNGTTSLTWSSTNATSCTASGSWTGSRGMSGTETTSALANTATFTLTCTGAGGTASDSVTVSVTPGGGGGGGGGGSGDSGGGGSFGWLSLAFLALLAARRRAVPVQFVSPALSASR